MWMRHKREISNKRQMWEQVWERKMEFRFLFNKNNYIQDISGGDEGIRTLETLPGLLP